VEAALAAVTRHKKRTGTEVALSFSSFYITKGVKHRGPSNSLHFGGRVSHCRDIVSALSY
jgi:hypothetical protein